uniref:Uncharacterized protein n=2 Tax=viral metagenome TaxID=1070528 RepID=A0A6M3LVN6_9ZZZZ
MWWLKTNGEKATVKTRQRLREVAGIIKEFHKMKKWQVQSLADKEEYMNLEEEVANARKNSEYAKQRRKEKLATKPVTASVIPALMRDFVEEPGIVYSEGAVSKAEEKKIHGSMKNWLTYCERDGVDPREQLRKVCENWIHFSVGQLVREDGTTIVLPDRIVSFNNYFKYRREIDRWLVQDALDEDNKVIDLDEKRQERDEGGIGI